MDPRVIVGPGDDAGVCLFGNDRMVLTVDVITPLVDDPYTFGAISAANSISDVYAMGGTPVTALAVLGFPSCEFEHDVIKNVIRGAVDKLKEADATLIGGHSIEDAEFKFGLAVTGRVDKDKILKAQGAKAGDILILTKPLGIGILSSAFKKAIIKNKDLKAAISQMTTLNKKASIAAVRAGAHAATDITGFGLLGHALNMAKGSKTDFVISFKHVPLLKKTKELSASGIAPKGAHNNLNFFSDRVIFPEGFSKEDKLILSDPQTSGGLLIAVPQEGISRFRQSAKRQKLSYWEIGRVVKGKGRIVIE